MIALKMPCLIVALLLFVMAAVLDLMGKPIPALVPAGLAFLTAGYLL